MCGFIDFDIEIVGTQERGKGVILSHWRIHAHAEVRWFNPKMAVLASVAVRQCRFNSVAAVNLEIGGRKKHQMPKLFIIKR